MRSLLAASALCASAAAFAPSAVPAAARATGVQFARPVGERLAHPLSKPSRAHEPCATAASAPTSVVVTDMDETLISKKSTGFVVSFLKHYRAWLRLLLLPLLSATLIPLSKVNRSLAVRLMYWFAFRGVRIDRARKIASEKLSREYVQTLQDPAASAVLDADAAVIITASPSFMAQPWLTEYLGVPASNIYGAELGERNGRFTGRLTNEIPISDVKVRLLKQSVASGVGVTSTGYGDHPTDVPFLEACDRGVLVEPLPKEQAGSCTYEAARPFDLGKLGPKLGDLAPGTA